MLPDALVLTSYNQQKNILDVQTCDVGVMMLVTSGYCDSYSYCISEGATLLMLEALCILLSTAA